ncbi:methyltransferase type 11 [Fusarium langsethiae]|uniref:Methyltransferase type 11 n=1 Tax=Fusarium langsethiae TaxID=179993 RepID=A0A0N0V5E2_FUSLA|nr:methyltransferase type 11 [Fusarium langsethiae]
MEMESPSKRKRSQDHDDPEKTPQAQPNAINPTIFDNPPPPFNVAATSSDDDPTDATSLFSRTLAARPHFPKPKPPSSTRSLSPSKQYRKRSDLQRLDHPIHFSLESDLKAALPADAHDLYDALDNAHWGVDILPYTLKDRNDVKIPGVKRTMWQEQDPNISENDIEALIEKHKRIEEIVKRTKQCADRGRSEAAWNHIHDQVLHLFAETPSVIAEDITTARIVPRFRPCIITQDDDSISSVSSHTSSHASTTSRGQAINSVHKMVDFALTLEPDVALARTIEQYTRLSADGTINQTSYFPLKNCPAPVFIETKTASGNLDTSGVQLGVWIAAWHASLRSIMTRGGVQEQIITVPLIQVLEGSWTVMYAVDADDSVKILYSGQVIIGSSNSLMGMYQLQAALNAIVKWMEGPFRTWITRVLTTALQ